MVLGVLLKRLIWRLTSISGNPIFLRTRTLAGHFPLKVIQLNTSEFFLWVIFSDFFSGSILACASSERRCLSCTPVDRPIPHRTWQDCSCTSTSIQYTCRLFYYIIKKPTLVESVVSRPSLDWFCVTPRLQKRSIVRSMPIRQIRVSIDMSMILSSAVFKLKEKMRSLIEQAFPTADIYK